MKSIIYKGAINPLSFGNVSYNLMREMYKSGIEVAFFPIGDNLNFESFDKIESDFRDWVISASQNRFRNINKDLPTLSQWHLSGSESRISKHQTLFTFYETDQPTYVEQSISNLQDNMPKRYRVVNRIARSSPKCLAAPLTFSCWTNRPTTSISKR